MKRPFLEFLGLQGPDNKNVLSLFYLKNKETFIRANQKYISSELLLLVMLSSLLKVSMLSAGQLSNLHYFVILNKHLLLSHSVIKIYVSLLLGFKANGRSATRVPTPYCLDLALMLLCKEPMSNGAH